jgi:hypothetical protein
VYVADTGNSTIRKVTSNGVVTTLAGRAGQTGTADGTNSAARFNHPSGVAVDGDGNLYIADTVNCTIRKVAAGGVVTTLAGSPGQPGNKDGTNGAAGFDNPTGVAVDSAGNIYVADLGNSAIRKVTSAGVVTTLAGSAGEPGSTDGTNQTARFSNPSGVAVDSDGNVYVADAGNKTIRQVTSAGVVTTLAGSPGQAGSADGTNSLARFGYPFGVAVDATSNLYVADLENFTIRQVTSAGVVTTLAGSTGHSGSEDGADSAARFAAPSGVAVDGAGNVYVADYGNCTIREIMGGTVSTLAGEAGQSGSNDITGSAARYFNPNGVAVDAAGNVYVADTKNFTIRKMTPDGGVTTLAGEAGHVGSVDGANATARFNYPFGLAVDSAGNVYVADTYNSTIRKVTSSGVVTTLAGSAGQFGMANGAGGSALFSYPASVAVDNSGNVYVADSGNNLIRKIDSSGEVTTFAGDTSGRDGAGLLDDPCGVAVDSAGAVYVADSGDHTIQKVIYGGGMITLAGSAGVAGSTDGATNAARFNFPQGLVVDGAGNVYVADTGNNTVRKVTLGGGVTTIGGRAGVTGGADGIGSSANFAGTCGITMDRGGRLYVADAGNNRISLGAPMPAMSVNRSALGMVVTWPAFLTGFVLQQNSNLSNANGWSTASYGISDDGTNNRIILLPQPGNVFFRLRSN